MLAKIQEKYGGELFFFSLFRRNNMLYIAAMFPVLLKKKFVKRSTCTCKFCDC